MKIAKNDITKVIHKVTVGVRDLFRVKKYNSVIEITVYGKDKRGFKSRLGPA